MASEKICVFESKWVESVGGGKNTPWNPFLFFFPCTRLEMRSEKKKRKVVELPIEFCFEKQSPSVVNFGENSTFWKSDVRFSPLPFPLCHLLVDSS